MRVANAPCSWGILEFGLDGTTDKYQKVLDEMSETGYKGTELGDWGFLPTNPEILKKELDKRDLKLVGAFVPINFINRDDHEEGVNTAVKVANLLKNVAGDSAKVVLSDDNGSNTARTKNAGRIRSEHGLKLYQWKTFISGVEYIAEKVLQETGISSVFHHHCAGYIETHEEIDTFLNLTDPDLIGLCFDTGHYAYGGGDPVEGLQNFDERIEHVHFKDWDKSIFQQAVNNHWDYFQAVGNGVFCELGKGSIQFEEILNELDNQNYSGWIVVEQDILPGMGTPKESALRNRHFLKSIGI